MTIRNRFFDFESEFSIHIAVVKWFNLQYPILADDFHHFANERRCTPREGYTLKRMGVKRGVPDFFLAYPRNNYAGLWLELKSKNGKLSAEQKLFLERKSQNGYAASCAWSFEQAQDIINKYLS